MAVILGLETLRGVLNVKDTVDLLEEAFSHEGGGRTFVSPKNISHFEGGSMRILLAADYQSGVFATKAYHHIEGVGVRYVVSLYRLVDGELLAILDGQLITDLRTGGVSGVVARKIPIEEPASIGVLGSGNQARTQLECLAAVHRFQSVAVYSPTRANREAFASEMTLRLGIPVTPVDSPEAAARGRSVVATASNSRSSEPILKGEWLDACRLLCAVGNTRPQFAEADVRCFRDARLVVVDSVHAFEEAGDLRRAIESGAIPDVKRATVAQLVSESVPIPQQGMVAFKSVGTALQDLALAKRYYELLHERPGLAVEPDLARLRKPRSKVTTA